MKPLFRFNTKIFGILALALALPLSIGSLEAAKPGACDTDPPHPSCNDDGGGDLPSDVSNWSGWISDGVFIYEPGTRLCTTDGGNPEGGGGHYACNPPHGDGVVLDYPVIFNLGEGKLAKKGDASLCSSFAGEKFPDYRYIYAWEGPCRDYCDVFVYHTFRGDLNHGVQDVGLVHMIAEGYVTGPFDDLNPFAQPQDINIQEIDITFYAVGTSKKLANCHWEFYGSEAGPVLRTDLPE